MKCFKKILAAVDFSKNSDYAFDYALTLAKKFNSRICVVHVIEYQFDLGGYYEPHPSLNLLTVDFEENIKTMLKKFCESKMSDFSSYTSEVIKGVPYREILHSAEQNSASLIVLGTHGRTGLDRLVFGSTAERVVRGSACPVLTIPLSMTSQ